MNPILTVMKTQKEKMKETGSRASCTSKSRTNTWVWMKKEKKKESEEVGGKELLGREIERCGYFRIQSRIRDKLGSDRSRHTSTLAVNSKLCVASLSHSDAPPPTFPLLSLTPSYPSSLSFSFFPSSVPQRYCFLRYRLDWVLGAGRSMGLNLAAVRITTPLKFLVGLSY